MLPILPPFGEKTREKERNGWPLERRKQIDLSLVVPCFNEGGNVRRFQEEVREVFAGSGLTYELVFVDDGSRDDTLAQLRQLFQEGACPIQIVRFSRNFGKEAAMLAGLQAARGELITLIDADLQQPPATVLDMVRILREEPQYDCVAAYQDQRKEGKLQGGLKDAFYRLINKFSDVEFVANASDFRTMRRPVAEALVTMGEYHRFSKGLFSWVGFATKFIPYQVRAREAGETKWSLPKLFRYAWDGILSFSTAPIKIAIYLGLTFALLAMIYLVVVLVQKLAFSIAVPGYATIVCLILLLGGLQLFFLGILGEYIGRIYIQVKQRPVYLVKEHLTWEASPDQGGAE